MNVARKPDNHHRCTRRAGPVAPLILRIALKHRHHDAVVGPENRNFGLVHVSNDE